MYNAEKHDKPEANALTRRNFLGLGLGALSALAVLEIGGASLMFLRARSLEGEYGGTITAGVVDDFPPGSVTEFDEGNFFLVRSQDGGFLAVFRRCPHLGCSVKWVEEKGRFYCPCHASSFDEHGDFINQPVPRALDSFGIKIKENQVLVDTSKMNRRERFSPDELVYS
jgi:cytochrome b6-f complex iron-sulfur subunit